MTLRCDNCGAIENVEPSDELGVTLCGNCYEKRADKADSAVLSFRLDAAVERIRRYVVLRPEQADVIALWIAHTYVFDSFPITPYLNVKSATKQAGKTRLLEVIRPLTSNPVDCDGITPAALIRTVDVERPTLLLDEMDALFGGSKEGGEAVRGILNSGFRARGRFLKCVGEGSNMTVREYATFCPKVLSGIGSLPDTVTDRSVPIKMHRRAPGEQVAPFRERAWEQEAAPIARGIGAALESHRETLADARPQTPEGLSDRAQDAWEPLLAIADLASGDWPDRARRAAVALSGNRDVDEEEIGVRLLAALRSAFEESATNKITSQCFLDHLHEQADEPWADWSRGNPISATKVAVLLGPFELKSKKIRIGDQTPRGYEWRDCEDAFLRYLPRDGGSKWNKRNNGSNKPETAPSQSGTEAACSTLRYGEKPHEQADVPGVPLCGVGTGGNGRPRVLRSQEHREGSALVWDFTERLERVGIEHEDAP